ncbi:MAG TPA: ATP-binding protein [Kofleriaceae bacterium]
MLARLKELVPAQGATMVVAPDGLLAAVVEARRVVVIDLSHAAPLVELAVDPAAGDAQVGWIGDSRRLLLVERHAAHSSCVLVDPRSGRRLVQQRFAGAIYLGATRGDRALAASGNAITVIRATDTNIVMAPLPLRDRLVAVGAAGDGVVIAHANSIDEWDLQSRTLKRRLRLSRHCSITALGGSERLVWVLAQEDPHRIEVLPLGNRVAAVYELPEGISEIAGDPHTDMVACVGARTGAIYAIDLRTNGQVAPIMPGGIDRVDHVALITTPRLGVLAMQAGRALVFMPLTGARDHVSPVEPTLYSVPEQVELLASVELERPAEAAEVEAAPGWVAVEEEELAAESVPLVRDDSAYPAIAPPRPRHARGSSETSLAGFALRASNRRCSRGEYLTYLEHLRREVIEVAARAIARDWDSGRLAFSSADRPPAEAEVLGIAGRRSGLAASSVAEADEALEAAEGALRGARSALGDRLTPLDVLCAEHGIGPVGERVLVMIAAHSMWGELARLYGVLANDKSRATCDEHLVWQLLRDSVSRRDIAKELDGQSPLIRDGLVRIGDRARPFQALAANPIVVKLLAGAEIDAAGEVGIACVPSTVPLDKFVAPAEVIERAIAEIQAAPANGARVVVRGRPGSGRRTLLAALARLASRTLATIDAAMLVRDKRLANLPAMLQHANLCGWLPCVDGVDAIPSDDVLSRETVRGMLAAHHGPLTLRIPHHAKPPLDPGYTLIDLPTSTISERATQWETALAARGLAIQDPDALAAKYTVGPGTIERTVATIARTPARETAGAIDEAMRQHIDTKLGEVATRVTRLADWAQVVLPAEIKDSITELLARVRHRRKVYEAWGFDRVMTTSRGLAALFQGGPGTGKTLVASAIAHDLGLDLYRVDLSRLMSKWIGETEQNLGKLFDAAEEGQALILFDEADSLFGKRTEVRTSNDRYANLEVNYLLQRLDTFEGVAILTTNFGTAIDPAFKRRLSCRLTFPFPDDEARELLWRVHLPDKLPRAGKFDLAGLARRYRMSGGYIRNAALRAAFLAAEEQCALTQEHLERAVRAEFSETGKLAESGQLE